MAAPTIANTTQNLFGGGSPANPISITIPATGAGNTLILIANPFCQASLGANAFMNIATAQTNNSDSFVKDIGPANSSSGGTVFISSEIWRCQAPTTGSTSVSVNYSNSGASGIFGGYSIVEIHGAAASPIDGTPTSSNVGATNTLSITTVSGQGDVFFYAWSGNTGSDPSAPWAEIAAAGAFQLTQSQSSNGTISGTVSGATDPFVATMIAYAGTAGPPPMPPLVLGRHWDIQQTPVERHWLTRL